MALKGKREYTLVINGVTQNIKDVTTLENTLKSLDIALSKNRETTVKATVATKSKAAAMTDEEKAAERLAATLKRIEKVNSDTNRAQIEATRTLRERTREVTREIGLNQLAEGSIKAMGMTLTDLRNEYEELTAAERAEEEVGGALLAQIQALDAEYKALRESTGNFRDSVGNYEKALNGLNGLKDRFELVARGSADMAANVAGSNDVLDAFGATTDVVAKTSEKLAGVVGLATLAQEAYNAVTAEGFVQQKAAAIMDGVRALQLKAKTAAEAMSTKGTIAATIAQKAFNLVAYANPYVLLAMAIAAVGVALYAFANRTDTAAQKQKALNELQAIYLDQLDREGERLRRVGDERVKAAERALQLLQAQGAAVGKVRDAESKLAGERAAANARLRGFYGNELENIDENRKQVERLTEVIHRLNAAKALGEDKLKIDIDLDGKVDKVDIAEALDSVQQQVDQYNQKIDLAVQLDADAADIAHEAQLARENRLREDRETAKERAGAAAEARRAELEAVRAGEDARLALIADSFERERAILQAQSRRAIEDLRLRLDTEKNLSATARKAINDTIVALDQQLDRDLEGMEQERAARVLETARATEDTRLALIVSESERQRVELELNNRRIIDDIKIRLANETDLTIAQREDLAEQILNVQAATDRQLAQMRATALQAQAEQELSAAEATIGRIQSRLEGLVREEDGLNLIDVTATRANLAAANEALGEYVQSVEGYQRDLRAAHEATLETLAEGSPEYEAELQRYAAAMEEATKRIINAQNQQRDNAKASTNAQLDYYRDLGEKVSEIAAAGSEAVTSVFDTFSMGMEMQLEGMTAQLDAVTEKYEEAGKLREEAVKNVEEIEGRIQSATGGTAEAMREQLADAMAARSDAERQEQQLAKEKEKREAEIARKEKQIRRNDIIASMAQGLANTAEGVTKALTLIWPLNLIVAGTVGATGAAQVALMGRQLTKLEDGGPIYGPSHAQGGVYAGLGYEVEGGEFVTNKVSYAANTSVVEYINSTDRTVTMADLAGVVPGEVAASEPGNSLENRLVEALENAEFNASVAVTDINDVADNMAEVKDLAGF